VWRSDMKLKLKIMHNNVTLSLDCAKFGKYIWPLFSSLSYDRSKAALHIVRSRASSFKWEYPLLSLRSSNSFLHLLPWLAVTCIPPCILPLITRCRRQFVRRMWPIQFAFRLRISCRIFLCSLTWFVRLFSQDRASWYILITKANEMHYFSNLFW
jgi:hypothetical protein